MACCLLGGFFFRNTYRGNPSLFVFVYDADTIPWAFMKIHIGGVFLGIFCIVLSYFHMVWVWSGGVSSSIECEKKLYD
jgi:hypothetical protein